MTSLGEWGEFFPAKLSPHGYNETVAQDYMPLDKGSAEAIGCSWRKEKDEENYMGAPVEVSDSISDIDEDVCDKILVCEGSGKPFKITTQELKFYKQQGIPLPRRSPAQRHIDRDKLRNTRTLWKRTCTTCKQDISTSYSPERPEKVYCESCYLSEVC
jgi:hypothetical protein